MSDEIKLIVGLGNPGAEYADTRHNVGFWLIDAFAAHTQTTFRSDSKFSAVMANLNHCHLLKPTTFMNDSGRAVSAFSRFYKLKTSEILIIHDELDLPVGTLRLKYNGGHGGHNGIRSIIACIGNTAFYRLRIGIGHPGHKDQVTPYVLTKPPIAERQDILETINRAVSILPDIIQGEAEKVMHILHSP